MTTTQTVCAWCNRSPIRAILDSEALCQSCCNKWARGEGIALLEAKQEQSK